MLTAVRLNPGDDLQAALAQALAASGQLAGYVVSGIGSLDRVAIRYAGEPAACVAEGRFEILSLAGSLSPDGVHLHMAVADHLGGVRGGHVKEGCRIATTAEVLLAWLPGSSFAREPDPATGYLELVVRSRGAHG
jgi:predicted DNA-binding protein with PD1-like motif